LELGAKLRHMVMYKIRCSRFKNKLTQIYFMSPKPRNKPKRPRKRPCPPYGEPFDIKKHHERRKREPDLIGAVKDGIIGPEIRFFGVRSHNQMPGAGVFEHGDARLRGKPSLAERRIPHGGGIYWVGPDGKRYDKRKITLFPDKREKPHAYHKYQKQKKIIHH
jgi:hypothetical protein